MEHNQQVSQTLALLSSIFPATILLDFDQVGQVINASKSSCYLKASRGDDFPKVTKLGSRSLVKITDLASWIDNQESVTKAAASTVTLEKKKRGRPTKQAAAARAAEKGGAQ